MKLTPISYFRALTRTLPIPFYLVCISSQSTYPKNYFAPLLHPETSAHIAVVIFTYLLKGERHRRRFLPPQQSPPHTDFESRAAEAYPAGGVLQANATVTAVEAPTQHYVKVALGTFRPPTIFS